jgi:HEAT repeat protein
MDSSWSVGDRVVVVDRGAGTLREVTGSEYVVQLADGPVHIAIADAGALVRSAMSAEAARAVCARMGDRTKSRGDLRPLASQRAFSRASVEEKAEYMRVLFASSKLLSAREREIIGAGEHLLLSELSLVLGIDSNTLRDAIKKGKALPEPSPPTVSAAGSELDRALDLLRSGDVHDVQQGLELMGASEDPRVTDALLEALSLLQRTRPRGGGYVAAQAVGALGSRGDPRATRAILEYMAGDLQSDDDDQIQEVACEALVNLGSKEALPFLRAAMHADDWEYVERDVARALRILGGAQEIDFFVRALASPRQGVVVAALEALAELSARAAIPAIEPFASSGDAEVRTQALLTLALVDPPRAPGAVRAIVANATDDAARSVAIAIAKRLGSAEIAPVLEERLDDPEWQQSPWVRFELSGALLVLGSSQATELLERTRADAEHSPWCRALASALLLRDGRHPQLVPELIAFVRRVSEHQDERDTWNWIGYAGERILERLDEATKDTAARVAFVDLADDIRRERLAIPYHSIRQSAGAIVRKEVGSDRFADYDLWRSRQVTG